MVKKVLVNKVVGKLRFVVCVYICCSKCGCLCVVYCKFGLCRICLCEMVYVGELFGVQKSSW